jgi:hypothetical protein
LDLLEVVDAADERRLSGSGRSDDDNDLPTFHGERDAFEDLVPTERLVDIRGLEDNL